MKSHFMRTASIIALFTLSSNAFAIDQIILKNGGIVEGKILNDVPLRYVDIELVNGSKKRYQQTDVASVERDVPSNVDSHMHGNQSEIFIGANVGGYTNLVVTTAPLRFNWGGRFGVNVTQLGDFSKLAFALAYNNTSATITSGVITETVTLGEFALQMLFRKVENTGFYFGPEIGLAVTSLSVVGSSVTISDSEFDFGGIVGYDYYFSDSFSMGPVVQLTHSLGYTPLKFGLDLTVHF